MGSFWTILAIVIVVFLIVGVVVWFMRRRKPEPAPTPRGPHDPFAPDQNTGGDPSRIQAGDMLEFGNDKYFVRGTLRITEGAYHWAEHFFQADATDVRQWLTVEQDPDLQVSMWRDRPDVGSLEPADRLTIDDVHYRLDERGTATYQSEGTTGLRPSGQVEYVDYTGPSGQFFSLERFDGGNWEASSGVSVPVGSFTIYPGS